MMTAGQLKWLYEILALIFSLIAAFVILLPIINYGISYPFYVINGIYVLLFITAFRYLFFMQYSPLHDKRIFKVGWILATPLLVFILVTELGEFRRFMDEHGLQILTTHLPHDSARSMQRYIKNEMMLFSTGAIIASVILPFKLVYTIWKNYNKRPYRQR